MNATDDRPAAVVAAETGADGWTEVARHQRWADADHADFYSIAGDALATVHALEDLTEILTGQVGAYGQGRAVYDDSHVVDPAARIADAVAQLRAAHDALRQASRAVNEFWSAIGHIGVMDAPTPDISASNGDRWGGVVMNGPWDGPPWDEDRPVNYWPVEHGWPAGPGPAHVVPEQLLLAAAAAGAAGATVFGLLALLVGGVVVAVGLGALVLIGAAVVVSAAERGAR